MGDFVFLGHRINTIALLFLVIITPYLIYTIRNLMLSKASKHWAKINGMITKTEAFQLGARFKLQYEYTLGEHTFTSSRIFYSNTATYTKRLAAEFDKKYSKHQIINVFYNPNNPKQAVLEPGRTDGAIWIIGVLGVLFMLSVLSIFFPMYYIEFMDVLTQLFN